ncbi:MAG: extracellular solute-binding protein [Patescibacteria group bacterium]
MSITKDLNVFQAATMAIFLVIGAIGIVLFATSKAGIGNNQYKGVVWGVLPKTTIDAALDVYSAQGIDPNFTYVEYPEAGFGQAILRAVAEGRGPDAIIFPDTMYYDQLGKLVTIPTQTISAREFADTYIDAGNMFTVVGGIKAIPLLTDPMVMYYNKTMLTSAGLLYPPKTWSELAGMTNKITRKQDDGVINRAFVALGEYANILYAKEILYTLLSQAGIQLSYYDPGIGYYISGIAKAPNGGSAFAGATDATTVTESVLTYYTDFANPLKPTYTWNRAIAPSRDAFLAQNLAVYFGPASEVEYIRSRNPNLNFAIAPMPQENPNRKVVQGKTYALGFLITSQNVATVYPEVTKYFTENSMIQALADSLRIAPAKRALVDSAAGARDSVDLSIIYESAKYARNWIDPNPFGSNLVLETLIEAITSGKQTAGEAIQDASDRIDSLYLGQ